MEIVYILLINTIKCFNLIGKQMIHFWIVFLNPIQLGVCSQLTVKIDSIQPNPLG